MIGIYLSRKFRGWFYWTAKDCPPLEHIYDVGLVGFIDFEQKKKGTY